MAGVIKIDGKFLVKGNLRSDEYPDAQLFEGKEGIRAAFRYQASYQAIRKYRKNDPVVVIQLISNYGMDDQHLDLELKA